MDEICVVTTDRGKGGFLSGNRTQEVVGSIPISSTNPTSVSADPLVLQVARLLAGGDVRRFRG